MAQRDEHGDCQPFFCRDFTEDLDAAPGSGCMNLKRASANEDSFDYSIIRSDEVHGEPYSPNLES